MKFGIWMMSIMTLGFLSGCATESNQINLDTLLMGEKIYIGRVTINFNKLATTDRECVLFINSEFRPTMKISGDGRVYYKSLAPNLDFGQVACRPLSAHSAGENTWYNYTLSFNLIQAPEESNVISYVGDVVINWDTESDNVTKTASGLDRRYASGATDRTGGSPQGHEMNRIHNPGRFSVVVQDHYNEATHDFATKNPQIKNFKFKKSLLTVIGKQ